MYFGFSRVNSSDSFQVSRSGESFFKKGSPTNIVFRNNELLEINLCYDVELKRHSHGVRMSIESIHHQSRH